MHRLGKFLSASLAQMAMPPDRAAPNSKRTAPKLGGVTLLEMVLAVSLVAGLASTSLEWLTFQVNQNKAVVAARQLSGLAHLIRSYAEAHPLAFVFDEEQSTYIARHGENKVKLYREERVIVPRSWDEDRIPPGNLMAGRWPNDIGALPSSTRDESHFEANLPPALTGRIALPHRKHAGLLDETVDCKSHLTRSATSTTSATDDYRILGSDLIFTYPTYHMSMAHLKVRCISPRQAEASRRTAALLRRQGLPVLYEQNSQGYSHLTVMLLPLGDVLNPEAEYKFELDMNYKSDLIVGGVIAEDAKGHWVPLYGTHAPFDFTVREEDFIGRSTLASWPDSYKEGAKNLGGYSNFFYETDTCDITSSTDNPVKIRQCGGNIGSALYAVVNLRDHGEEIRRYDIRRGDNGGASFAGNAIVVSANLPGVAYPSSATDRSWFNTESVWGWGSRDYQFQWGGIVAWRGEADQTFCFSDTDIPLDLGQSPAWQTRVRARAGSIKECMFRGFSTHMVPYTLDAASARHKYQLLVPNAQWIYSAGAVAYSERNLPGFPHYIPRDPLNPDTNPYETRGTNQSLWVRNHLGVEIELAKAFAATRQQRVTVAWLLQKYIEGPPRLPRSSTKLTATPIPPETSAMINRTLYFNRVYYPGGDELLPPVMDTWDDDERPALFVPDNPYDVEDDWQYWREGAQKGSCTPVNTGLRSGEIRPTLSIDITRDIPYWYNTRDADSGVEENHALRAHHDYPVGKSLCAGAIPGFPLVMHNGIYEIKGAHVYGHMLMPSDRRLKRDLRPVQAPAGGLRALGAPALQRHYPDVLLPAVVETAEATAELPTGEIPAGEVDANGLVAILWGEVRAHVRQQRAEWQALQAELDSLTCQRLPEQCPTDSPEQAP